MRSPFLNATCQCWNDAAAVAVVFDVAHKSSRFSFPTFTADAAAATHDFFLRGRDSGAAAHADAKADDDESEA